MVGDDSLPKRPGEPKNTAPLTEEREKLPLLFGNESFRIARKIGENIRKRRTRNVLKL